MAQFSGVQLITSASTVDDALNGSLNYDFVINLSAETAPLYLLGFVYCKDATPTAMSPSTMSWDIGGTPQVLTEIINQQGMNIWRKSNPSKVNGTLRISVTSTADPSSVIAGYMAFRNVDTTTPEILVDYVAGTDRNSLLELSLGGNSNSEVINFLTVDTTRAVATQVFEVNNGSGTRTVVDKTNDLHTAVTLLNLIGVKINGNAALSRTISFGWSDADEFVHSKIILKAASWSWTGTPTHFL
jgi:hypothetical protein